MVITVYPHDGEDDAQLENFVPGIDRARLVILTEGENYRVIKAPLSPAVDDLSQAIQTLLEAAEYQAPSNDASLVS